MGEGVTSEWVGVKEGVTGEWVSQRITLNNFCLEATPQSEGQWTKCVLRADRLAPPRQKVSRNAHRELRHAHLDVTAIHRLSPRP
jgi:hypothetical protein